ncbi:UDP-N-acetylmuramoyl-tripeptide--D-alanyl-D-alanine ligase [Vreelandella rituensis]|uniref:UDP-N-acetylmuramoyl-tripeptide--D-alanyl-D-alanine ligase n=1 Tax=Vreelandella rituensis TaxID=2282306 RepID=A0A368TV09_9GAMM|nr:UDP-N-acetylmuramoyl-tripeptide--D-alanyl-D-alanine ligase [Halomonas rituensis]RCV88490.1 UDP-N-acetylmuramoyl-tripeptide--D-alanyl-D-alanine ligase [Halomonas rituensis]
MRSWTLAEVAQALAIPPPAEDLAFTAIVTDTRRVIPGCLFVALKGERFDAHDFIAQAREQGAAAALVARPVTDVLPQIQCSDTQLALGLLGRYRRECWGNSLVAVTGNSGKTTVKEILAVLLGGRETTLATQGNLNNAIGAPLTLLELDECHQSAVVELGANHLGEIAWTAAMAKPQVAVITNVTGAHIGEFGGMGNIAQAKGEILTGLSANGVAVLNHDDVYYHFWAALAAPRQVWSFGLDERARVHARALSRDAVGRYAFTLVVAGCELGRVSLPLLGKHNVSNALAASAAALALGVESSQVISRLSQVSALPGRLCAVEGPHGACILDDSYNANPGAMQAALETLASLPGPHWCAFGAMGELGSEAERLHIEVGEQARVLGIEVLLTFGEAAQAASRAFGAGGLHFTDHAALVRHVINTLPPGASLLVKGSRSAAMDTVVAALRSDKPR